MHAASTGVTEETEVIQRHSHPQYRKLKFYDLPVLLLLPLKHLLIRFM